MLHTCSYHEHCLMLFRSCLSILSLILPAGSGPAKSLCNLCNPGQTFVAAPAWATSGRDSANLHAQNILTLEVLLCPRTLDPPRAFRGTSQKCLPCCPFFLVCPVHFCVPSLPEHNGLCSSTQTKPRDRRRFPMQQYIENRKPKAARP